MPALLGLIASFCWGAFTAAMGHPVFGSVGNTVLTLVPCFAFGPAFRAYAQMFSEGR